MQGNTSTVQWQRHMLHLMTRVLSIRNGASPFTLVLDDLNQQAGPLIDEFVRRARSRNINVIILSFESKAADSGINHISAWSLHSQQILEEVERALKPHKESIVIIDSLYDLLNDKKIDMGALFNLIAVKHRSTLIGVWHQDLISNYHPREAYTPQPLDLVRYMATAIITCKSFAHVLAAKAAKERSLPEPTHGLLQSAEGIVQSLDANDQRGIVLEAEFRRQSGREESGVYFLRPTRPEDYQAPAAGLAVCILKQEFVTLLDMVPAYASKEAMAKDNAATNDMLSTFNLDLTDKQKEARDGVVLPYFDAQKIMGDAGEGGRILYDMGSEDDFDEEEDEI